MCISCLYAFTSKKKKTDKSSTDQSNASMWSNYPMKIARAIKTTNQKCPFAIPSLLKSFLQTLSNGSRISSRFLFIPRLRTYSKVTVAYYSHNSYKKIAKMSDMEELWKSLQEAVNSKSLLRKHLTPARYERLKNKKTKFGGTLADCMRSGCKNPDSGVGIYACDPDAYTTFAEVLDAVIMDYHKIDKVTHPQPSFGDVNNLGFGDLDPSGDLIVSTRVRVGRSHASYGFPPVLSKEDRINMEKVSVEALQSLEGELSGQYYPLTGMTPETQQKLTADHFLFNDSDRFLKAAGGYDDWPTGRGIYFNQDKTFLCWVNEEDHLRLISMQKGGNLAEVYKRLVKAIEQMEKKLTFAKKDNMGYLTFCPSNLGTTMRASVHIKIPKVSQMPDFKEVCDRYNLQARGIHGEHTESVGGVYDISNKRRMGLTEFEAVTEMMRGVNEIIRLEKS